MEAHCVNLELKYRNQALKEGQHGQFSKVTSKEAKVKHDWKRIFKKKAKNDQARDGKDKVNPKPKSVKVSHMKKMQLEGLKLPNLKLYYKRKRQGSKLQTGQSLH
ncbi:hypothetical protein Tco_1200335 [Tanacetum coccineum]